MSRLFRLQGLLLPIMLLNVTQVGCGFPIAPAPIAPGPGADSPELAALRMVRPPNGAQRLSIVRPAPEGGLVVFEDIAQQPEDPSIIQIGWAYATFHASGWETNESGRTRGRLQHSVLLSMVSSSERMERMIFYGKVVDPRVAQIVVGFPSGQVRDTVVNGLFGTVVVPYTLVCRIELLDAEERQIGLFDQSGKALDLVEVLHDRAAEAKQGCGPGPENEP